MDWSTIGAGWLLDGLPFDEIELMAGPDGTARLDLERKLIEVQGRAFVQGVAIPGGDRRDRSLAGRWTNVVWVDGCAD